MKLIDLLLERAPTSYFVRKEIRKNSKDWKNVGQGASASVWKHALDPNVVIKVVGGGDYDLDDLSKHEIMCAMAFVDFCVHEGTNAHPSDKWREHYPNILGINTDDEDVIQIRMESLKPIKSGPVLYDLSRLARMVSAGEDFVAIEYSCAVLGEYIARNKKNDFKNLYSAVLHLDQSRKKYGKEHNIKLRMDLHQGNWLQTPGGVIVAVDPWFGK